MPTDRRMWAVFRALDRGWTVEELHELTKIDPLVPDAVLAARRAGSARRRSSACAACRPTCCARSSAPASAIASSARSSAPTRTRCARRRLEHGLKPAYKRIDTCAAEFESFTPYLYGTYEQRVRGRSRRRAPKVVILGSGPNRIGQGIEFDYCCCHAAFALREEGFETVMVNCNPETVSTDYDTVDRLYFEPLTFEDVSAIIAREQEAGGDVVVRRAVRRADAAEAGAAAAGGRHQDPRHLAGFDRPRRGSRALRASCCGSSASRRRRAAPRRPPEEAREVAATIGFPLVVRPSYVLGGRAMAIVYDMARARPLHDARRRRRRPDHPILIDKFLEDAVELDVDAVADSTGAVVIGGIMEHIEEAGIHSGDSSCVVPPYQGRRAARRADPRLHAPDRPGAQGRRPDERAVRDQGRHGLRARSEPARVADGAVPVEGDRRAARQGRGARDDRQDARAARADRGSRGRRLSSSRRRCSRSSGSRASTRSSVRR